MQDKGHDDLAKYRPRQMQDKGHDDLAKYRPRQPCKIRAQRPCKIKANVYPGTEFFHAGSRIINVYTDPRSASASKNLGFLDLGNMIQDVHPGPGSRILILIFTNPDPGCRAEKAPDPGSATLIFTIVLCIAIISIRAKIFRHLSLPNRFPTKKNKF
jgi:hypothetical protein